MIWNYLGIALILVSVVLYIFYVFKQNTDEKKGTINRYSVDFLCGEIKEIINDIINQDIDMIGGLSKKERINVTEQKNMLSKSIRMCSQGNIGMKEFVCDKIKEILQNEMKIDELNINYIISFQDDEALSTQDKLEILMYTEKSKGIYNIFKELNLKCNFDKLKKDERGYFYSIDDVDILNAYKMLNPYLDFNDKLNVLTQRIYQELYGLSVADIFIMDDTSIDSISGGVTGINEKQYRYMEEIIENDSAKRSQTFESIFVFFGGKPIHIKFLSFKNNINMARVCKNLAESGNSGTITKVNGIKKTHLADGSRVTVCRSGNTTHWSFYARKFTSIVQENLSSLIIDKNNQIVIELLIWMMKGNINLILSGDQNSGKTTCLRVLIKYIDRRYPVRLIDEDFEIGEDYPDQNIQAFQPTEGVNWDKLISLIKKTDAHTIIFGETGNLEQAYHCIDVTLAGTKRIITTGHWPTVDEEISYFVMAMKQCADYGSSEDTEGLITRLINIDVHWVKDADGKRHIERISEIIPLDEEDYDLNDENNYLEVIARCFLKMVRKKNYVSRNIIEYINGEYVVTGSLSEKLKNKIRKSIIPEDVDNYEKFLKEYEVN